MAEAQNKSLNESIIKIRVELQKSKLKKSGKNKYAGFDYYELKDFLPRLNELLLQENVNDKFSIENDEVILTLMKGEEKQEYKMPFVLFETPSNKNGSKSMQDIQYLGALNTYYKRYLYLNAFGITDGEVIDSMDNSQVITKSKTTTKKGVQQIDYKTALLAKLDELDINRNQYAKEHNLSAKTTQEEAKKLLDELSNHIEKDDFYDGEVYLEQAGAR